MSGDQIVAAKRVGIDYAEEFVDKPWRLCVTDSDSVSRKGGSSGFQIAIARSRAVQLAGRGIPCADPQVARSFIASGSVALAWTSCGICHLPYNTRTRGCGEHEPVAQPDQCRTAIPMPHSTTVAEPPPLAAPV